MQAALRSLGTLDANERVRRYVSEQQQQTARQLQHDIDCVCRECERQQGMYTLVTDLFGPLPFPMLTPLSFCSHISALTVLGLRRIRRSVPTNNIPDAAIEHHVPPSIGAEAERPEPVHGSINATKMPNRRRPGNENARRGESKLGRASNLRPGRITLGSLDSLMPKEPVKARTEVASPLGPSLDAPVHCAYGGQEKHDDDPCASASSGGSSWNIDEHSLHSNMMHYEARQMKERGPELGTAIRADPEPSTEVRPGQDSGGELFDDFYLRNPAALANGWLALSHHRDVPAWANRDGPSPAIDNAIRSLIRPNQPQLLGLLPELKRRPRHHKNTSCHK